MSRCLILTVLLLALVPAPHALAQDAATRAEGAQTSFQIRARAVNAVQLMAGQNSLYLWGVEAIEQGSPAFRLRARTALDNVINSDALDCEQRRRDQTGLYAQCSTASGVDLGLFMLQQGFVTADRAAIFGTVFEDAYVQAEVQAQQRNMGIWGESGLPGAGSVGETDGAMLMSVGFVLFLFVVAAFAALTIIIMRGFQRVIDAQNDNVQMMLRERKLRDKERSIVASMLDSELKANKSKIEAFLVVYEETLRALRDMNREPKYKQAGDIIQRQPALDRSVFDRNTDKVDVLGADLSSQLVHFYARIKTNPEYANLEPDMERHEAIEIVETAVQNGQRLNELADRLLAAFRSGGFSSSI